MVEKSCPSHGGQDHHRDQLKKWPEAILGHNPSDFQALKCPALPSNAFPLWLQWWIYPSHDSKVISPSTTLSRTRPRGAGLFWYMNFWDLSDPQTIIFLNLGNFSCALLLQFLTIAYFCLYKLRSRGGGGVTSMDRPVFLKKSRGSLQHYYLSSKNTLSHWKGRHMALILLQIFWGSWCIYSLLGEFSCPGDLSYVAISFLVYFNIHMHLVKRGLVSTSTPVFVLGDKFSPASPYKESVT